MRKRNKVTARFRPETRFDVTPIPVVPFRGAMETDLESLKTRLLQELLEQTTDLELYAPLRRAATEAAALAWFTPAPLLFLPCLLEEKARSVQQQGARQHYIRQKSQNLLEEVAA